MPKNIHGEDMRFQFARPVVTDHDAKELLGICKNVPSLDFIVSQSTVEDALATVGKMLLGGYALPGEFRPWWEGVDCPMKILVGIATRATVGNSYYITNRNVERAVFAMIALEWLENG